MLKSNSHLFTNFFRFKNLNLKKNFKIQKKKKKKRSQENSSMLSKTMFNLTN